MDTVLRGLKGISCLVYLDDIIVYSTDLNSYLKALDEVLAKLREVNLSVQLSKCNFMVDEVDYLGHKISKRGVEPDPGKINAVMNYPVPKTVKDVRAFLGLAGYYRRFIEGFAEIGRPLFDLTRQGKVFEWDHECQAAFDRLKQKLVTAPVLAFPDFSKPFILATDASTHALGAVLSQVVDGHEHPVAYASRTLFPAEKNYSTTERELLGLVWSTKYFRCYLLGREFKVITDHAALKWMLSLKDPSSRLMRWSLRLAEFKFSVEHKAGKRHTNADGLSRAVCETDLKAEDAGAELKEIREQFCNLTRVDRTREMLPIINLDTLREHQSRDAHCQDLKRGKSFRMSAEKILYRLNKGEKKIVVPASLTREVIRLNHDLPSAGHAATAKTLSRVRAKFWWKNMEKDVLDYVRTCKSCSQRTDYGRVKAPLGTIFNEPDIPFEVIAADIVGPLPLSNSGNKYILSVMDHFSRYCEFIPLPEQTAEQVARALIHRVITKFGIPKSLLTDRGANFTSDLIKQMCQLLHVRKLQTTGFHPQSDGRLERVHATIAKMLSHFVNSHQNNWDEYLPYITMAYNSQVHEATGFSPFELVFGRKMETPLEGDLKITEDTRRFNDHVEDLRSKLMETHELAVGRNASARQRAKRQYDKKTRVSEFQVGQYVYLHVPSLKRHRTKKLARLWKGPYLILEVPTPLNVVLSVRKRRVRVHVNRIKPCLDRVPPVQPANDALESEVAAGMESGREENHGEVMEEAEDSAQEGTASGTREAVRPPRVRARPKRFDDYV